MATIQIAINELVATLKLLEDGKVILADRKISRLIDFLCEKKDKNKKKRAK